MSENKSVSKDDSSVEGRKDEYLLVSLIIDLNKTEPKPVWVLDFFNTFGIPLLAQNFTNKKPSIEN